MAKRKLTAEQIEAMRAVEDGADVFSYGIAVSLREVQSSHADFITIVKAAGRYPGHKRLPYFGAILTDKGKAALRKAGA